MTQNTICQTNDSKHFMAYMATVENIITYALGEHDPGSVQDGRTSSEM